MLDVQRGECLERDCRKGLVRRCNGGRLLCPDRSTAIFHEKQSRTSRNQRSPLFDNMAPSMPSPPWTRSQKDPLDQHIRSKDDNDDGMNVQGGPGSEFAQSSISPGPLTLDSGRFSRDSTRSTYSSNQARDSSPSSSSPLDIHHSHLAPASPSFPGPNSGNSSKSSVGASRSSSIFRMGRHSFGRKNKIQEKSNAVTNREAAKSLESQRSTGSTGSSYGGARGGKSTSSSPVLLRDNLSSSLPRRSMTSSRGRDSFSDVDGGRASSDLDSVVGNGRHAWTKNQSSGSLVSEPIAEGVEEMNGYEVGRVNNVATKKNFDPRSVWMSTSKDGGLSNVEEGGQTRPKGLLQIGRSASTSSMPRRQESGETLLAGLHSKESTSTVLHSPRSPRSPRSGGFPPPSIGQAPSSPLPPIPQNPLGSSSEATRASRFQAQRAPAPQIASSLNRPLQPKQRSNATSRLASRIKSKWTGNTMVDDEVTPITPPTFSSSFSPGFEEHSPKDTRVDLYAALALDGGQGNGQNVSGSSRKSSYQDALAVPTTSSGGRQVKKSRSQSSFKLTRRPSFFGTKLPNNTQEPEAEQGQPPVAAAMPVPNVVRERSEAGTVKRRPKTSEGGSSNNFGTRMRSSGTPTSPMNGTQRSPWDILTASRLEMADSSPEQERSQPFFSPSQRSREDSASSIEKRHSTSFSRPPSSGKISKGYASATSSRPGSPTFGSRLDSSGGAANLFGGASSSTPRQRASSLLPSLSWRPRTASNATAMDGLPRSISPTQVIIPQGTPTPVKEKTAIPKVDTRGFEGSPDALVQYALTKVPRTEVATVLASSADELHKQALSLFMQRFLFAGNPLDIALRKLLMSLCLPKETQQIDRVMEAFAVRYNECNEQLFLSNDQPYVLAFSLMMLHTDAFNKNAKQKMSKQDYLRNTASSGVRDEILEYLYDNLTFTQFIYVDDDEVLSRKKSEGDVISSSGGGSSFLSAFSSNNSSSSKNRIDPYYIIATGQTHTLRAEISSLIQEDTPFYAKGTALAYDVEALNRAFVNAPSIEIVTARRASIPNSAASALGNDDLLSTTFGIAEKDPEAIVTLRVTKVGCVSRKDDIVDENRKAQSRKWRTCGMLLSSSQLLFFKDLVWTSALDQQIQEQTSRNPEQEGGILITPRITYFRPDGVLALGDAIAVKDTTYTKYKNVFRLIARQGDQSRQYLLQSVNEIEMNDWIHKINFCAAFRAAGVRVRDLDPPSTPSMDGESPRNYSFSSSRAGSGGVVEGGELSMNGIVTSSTPSSPSIFDGGEGDSLKSAKGSGVPLIGLMRRKVIARRKEVAPKLQAVIVEFTKIQTELDENLRFARHLEILTPFMKVTRDRIEMTAIPLAGRIRQLRLDLARLRSRKEILEMELEAGDRAARATASAASFVDSEQRDWNTDSTKSSGYSSQDSMSLPMLPSSALDLSTSSPIRNYSANMVGDGGNMATPTLRTVPIKDEREQAATRGIGSSNFDQYSLSPLSPRSPSQERSSQEFEMVSRPEESMKSGSNSNSSNPLSPRRFIKPTSPKEEAERWDRSKVVKDSNRVSLVTLPDPEHLKDLSRMVIAHTTHENRGT